MNITNHAKLKSQQRGIPEDIFSLILQFGIASQKPGNAWEVKLGKKGKKRAEKHLKYLLQYLDKASKKAIITNSEMNTIITTYNINDKPKQ